MLYSASETISYKQILCNVRINNLRARIITYQKRPKSLKEGVPRISKRAAMRGFKYVCTIVRSSIKQTGPQLNSVWFGYQILLTPQIPCKYQNIQQCPIFYKAFLNWQKISFIQRH